MSMTSGLPGSGNILFKEQGTQKKKGNEKVETIHSKESGWEGDGERKLAKVKWKQGVNEKKVFRFFLQMRAIKEREGL